MNVITFERWGKVREAKRDAHFLLFSICLECLLIFFSRECDTSKVKKITQDAFFLSHYNTVDVIGSNMIWVSCKASSSGVS